MEPSAAELARFAAALSARIAGLDRKQFAAAVAKISGEGVSPAAVSQWTTGKNEPSRRKVFAIEKVLGEKPGALSRLLGYLPLEAKPAVTVEEALQADATLPPGVRNLLLAAVRDARKGSR